MAAAPTLYGPDGLPIAPRALSQPIAEPQIGGVRNIFSEFIAPGLTPERLANVLRQSAEGYGRDYLTLAEEMEEREHHYGGVLTSRKLAVGGIAPNVDPNGCAEPVVKAVQALVGAPDFYNLVLDMLDGLAKGYSVSEILWGTREGLWWPETYAWRDPRLFVHDIRTKSEIRLATDGLVEGLPLERGRFIVHVPKLKTGIPLRGGLARPAAFSFMVKSFALKDWLQFCEVFGMPIRLGKYHPGATEEDRRALLRAVMNIGIDAAGIIPDAMQMELIEVKAAGQQPFEGLARYLDEQTSKRILGQTMTSDNGSSMAQAKIHNEVRLELTMADCRDAAKTLNRDLVPWFVAFNFGPQLRYPTVELPVERPEDLKTLTAGLTALVPYVLQVSEAEVRGKFGLRDPKDGETVLKAPTPPPQAPFPTPGNSALAAEAAPAGLPALARSRRFRAEAAEATDAEIEAEGLSDWREDVDPILQALRDAAARSSSFGEYVAMLDRLSATLPVDKLMGTLLRGGIKARLAGLGDA